ncbi:MAG: hypothetical protein VX640_15685 [Pseudomonadota bacterium]|nr:hypothetical protein [Pseudomonadota bacterium]
MRIVQEGYNLDISRYISKAEPEKEIDPSATHQELVEIEMQIRESTQKHNAFLKELGLAPLPETDKLSKRPFPYLKGFTSQSAVVWRCRYSISGKTKNC